MATQYETRFNFIKNNPGKKIIGRDGYWYRCAHCGKWCGRTGQKQSTFWNRIIIPEEYTMEVDHIKPWIEGGSDEIWNLQPLCKVCNREKSGSIPYKDKLVIIKNDIIHLDFLPSLFRKVIRNSKILKTLGITTRK